jgi:phosphoenolpyruvate carboxylase
MDELSAAAFAAYRNLVYETDGFEQYFWESTVIAEIAALNIGSRPASRKKSTAIEDLRAIPWVFSWAQCRIMLPGWYGFGSAVEAYRAKHGEAGMARLKAMHHEWSFFATLLSNMDMVLAKSDIAIASRYADLVKDAALRQAIFPRIEAEHARTVETLLQISGQAELLDANPLLKRSIRNRFPTSTRSTTCRSSCSTATGTATRTSACAAASTCRSTASRRACATAAEGAP